MKEVVILGLGPTRIECPYTAGIPIWGVNTAYKIAPRVDLLFMFDDIDKFFPQDVEYLRHTQIPIMYQRLYPGMNITIYPLHEIIRKYRSTYFTNTICYAIAYALYQGYEKIHLYGVDMLIHTGYVMEKGGLEYWIGRAHGMGVDVFIPENSALCKTMGNMLYGYEFCYDDKFRIPEEIMVADKL